MFPLAAAMNNKHTSPGRSIVGCQNCTFKLFSDICKATKNVTYPIAANTAYSKKSILLPLLHPIANQL